MMKSGLEYVRMVPHHDAKFKSSGCTDSEKMLKQTSKRNGWMGSCMTGSTGEPQRSWSVPWMRDWRKMRRDRSRNADLESVERVSGRKMRTWRKLESLQGIQQRYQIAAMNGEIVTDFAVLVSALHRNHGPCISSTCDCAYKFFRMNTSRQRSEGQLPLYLYRMPLPWHRARARHGNF